jgi:thiamine-monophosphate kinase
VKVSELGEFGLIKLLTEIIEKNRNSGDASWQKLLVGSGDDAAVWECDGQFQLATTDCLVQDIHFDLSLGTWNELAI